MSQNELVPLHLHQYNGHPKERKKYSPVWAMVRGFGPHPPHPGGEVTGHVPDDPRRVSNPKYILQQLIYRRARHPLTCVVPKREGKGLHPKREQGRPRVPKTETVIDPINPRGELAELALAQDKN